MFLAFSIFSSQVTHQKSKSHSLKNGSSTISIKPKFLTSSHSSFPIRNTFVIATNQMHSFVRKNIKIPSCFVFSHSRRVSEVTCQKLTHRSTVHITKRRENVIGEVSRNLRSLCQRYRVNRFSHNLT